MINPNNLNHTYLLSSGQTDPSNLACTAINSTAVAVTWTQASDVSVLGYHIDVARVDGLRVEPTIPVQNIPWVVQYVSLVN